MADAAKRTADEKRERRTSRSLAPAANDDLRSFWAARRKLADSDSLSAGQRGYLCSKLRLQAHNHTVESFDRPRIAVAQVIVEVFVIKLLGLQQQISLSDLPCQPEP